MAPANCFAGPKLGSISSIRCQKSRTRVPEDTTCEVMFRGRRKLKATVSLSSLARLRSYELRRGSLRYDGLPSRSWRSQRRLVEPDGIEPTTSCLQSTRSPS